MGWRAAAAASALDWAYPPACAACGAASAGDGALCAPCWRTLELVGETGCRRCGAPQAGAIDPPTDAPPAPCDACRGDDAPWAQARCAVRYAGAARDLILAFKRADHAVAGRAIGRLLAVAARDMARLREGEADPPLFTPTPLHWTRRFRRRFNQSAELMRWACAGTSAQLEETLLRRVKPTPSLGGLSPAERRDALRGAFRISGAGARRRLQGRRIILVDDVLTTGATAAEATRVLYEAGAASVELLIFARVVRRTSDAAEGY